MQIYDLCVAWNWQYDADFVQALETACQAHQLSLLQVTSENLTSTLQALVDREISF